ncbi:ABC transporter permease [Bradyrhizobium sp. BRP14]|nr:ABC transporter permease [Bradyrhizobium sp. BRP14]
MSEIVAGQPHHTRPGWVGTAVQRLLSALPVTIPLLFIALFFIIPLGMILVYSISDSELSRVMPRTAALLETWDGGPPSDELDRVAATEIRTAFKERDLARVATRVNRDAPGTYSLLMRTGRALATARDENSIRLTSADPRWSDPKYLQAMKSAVGPLTSRYLLATVDVRRSEDGTLVIAPVGERLYLTFLVRTLWISIAVTVICTVLGYILAYSMNRVNPRCASVMLFLVLVPFWISLLVRTSAWVLMLRQDGIINQTLQKLAIITEPLALIYNRFGLYVAMVHILLPFVVLPIFNTMKTIPRSQTQAAETLGARPIAAFLQVYLPQTMPGVVSGMLLTFILATGFYVTPALIGGSGDQMLSHLVQQSAFTEANWGMASSTAILLLLAVIAVVLGFRLIMPKSWLAPISRGQ